MPPRRKVPPLSPEHKALGDAIKRLRKKAGLSQEALADASELDISHFGRIERGTSNPTYATLVRLATALETGVGAITGPADRLLDRRRRRLARD
jgi:transcriptional regulator with XRE-family HTH domain